MSINNSSIIIPILPSPIDLFGEWYSKPLIALDNYYHPDFNLGRERKIFNNIEECIDLFDTENIGAAITIEDFIIRLEWVKPHFHLCSSHTYLYDYISLLDYGENLINSTILEQMDDFQNIDFNLWEVVHAELVEFKKHGFDLFGTYSVRDNSLTIDYTKIQEYCRENDFFTTKELTILTVYHNYGHWLTKNLSISLDSTDFYFNDTVSFQELFAQLIVAHILHKEGNQELRAKFDDYSKTLPKLYQLYLDPIYSNCIENPDYLVLMLHTARIEKGCTDAETIEWINYAFYINKNNEKLDEWKDELRKDTNDFWRSENIFTKDAVENNICQIPECVCRRFEYKNSWGFLP